MNSPSCRPIYRLVSKSKAGNAYYRCMDCQVAFGDDGGKPGKRFEDRPAGKTAQKTSSAAGACPKCPTCKKPTYKNETKTGKFTSRP